MNQNDMKNQNNQNNAQNQNNQNNAQNQSNSNKKNAKNSKDGRTSGGVCKLPAGTPYSSEEKEGYGSRSTTDPAVPNRAHTEI